MTNNALQVFSYKGREVRTTEIDGEIWLVAKDVADILEIQNIRQNMDELDEDEKGVCNVYTPGGMQNMTVINEAGLYKLTFKSRKDEAKNFTRWVTHDVLPSIRKTGSYGVLKGNPELPNGVLEGARLIFETAGIKDNQLALAMDKVYLSYTGRSALRAGEIALTAPTKKQILTPTEIGTHFGLKPQRVNEILAGAGFQHKINGKWEALPPGEPYAVMQDVAKKHKHGTPIRQLKWDSSILSVFPALTE